MWDWVHFKAFGLLSLPAGFIFAQVGDLVSEPSSQLPAWTEVGFAALASGALLYLVREIIKGNLVSRKVLEDVADRAVDRAIALAEERRNEAEG